jgi:hypothetical protein
MIRGLVICLFLFMLVNTPSGAQDSALISLAPFGRPAAVRDLGNNWSAAIPIYSDGGGEAYVEDITRPGWLQWNSEEFLRTGKYSVYLYSHYAKKGYYCSLTQAPNGLTAEQKTEWRKECDLVKYMRRLITVDTRKKTVVVLNRILMESDAWYRPENYTPLHETYSLTDPAFRNSGLAKEVARISAIIEEEVK